jgi:hypothetical protein
MREHGTGTVGPIDERREDLAPGQIHRLERRAAVGQLETVIASGRRRQSVETATEAPAILQLGD